MGKGKQLAVLVLLEAQPVARGDVARSYGRGGKPGVDRRSQLGIALEAGGESDVTELELEVGKQLAQGSQPLQLLRTVQPVPTARPIRRHQPDVLDVAEHARRPASRGRRLVNRQAVHRGQP